MSKLLHCLLAALLFCGPVSGCAGALAAIPTAVSLISDASAVLAIIERALDTWFALVPPTNEVRQEANQLLADAWAALRIATSATKGAQELSDDDKKKAFESFKEAYSELHAFLKRHQVLAAGKLSVSPEGQEAEIPEPLAMKL